MTKVTRGILAMGSAALVLAACGSGGGHPAALGHHSARHGAHHATALPAAPAGRTLVATVHGTIPGYTDPGGPATATIPATWHGAVSSLPVIWAQPGWVKVRLAQRPNGSTAWVRDDEVTLSSTPYKILIDLQTRHLLLFKDQKLVWAAPAGIGTPTDPTPTGWYFVAFFAQSPSSGYGPFVLVTSDHSNTITDWESSGDALIAIHGPLGADGAIGTAGAAISHGCVRLHVSDLEHLRIVPTGSPIEVVSS
jgi:hypothetical protein